MEEAPEPLRPLIAAIDERVVDPLKAARDEVAWSETLDEVLDHWLRLRVALVLAIIELDAERVLDELEEAAGRLDEVPLTLLPEPAHGAARHAIAVLGGVVKGVLEAARQGVELEPDRVEALVRELAVIELAWLTIAGADRPAASVAEAAAWEAYSRVRPLRVLLAVLGIGDGHLPAEAPGDARDRAREMLARVARGWSPEERRAVEEARLPAGALQG